MFDKKSASFNLASFYLLIPFQQTSASRGPDSKLDGEAVGSVAVAELSSRQCRDDSPRLFASRVGEARQVITRVKVYNSPSSTFELFMSRQVIFK